MAGVRHFTFIEEWTHLQRKAFVDQMTAEERDRVEADAEHTPGNFEWYCEAAGFPMPPRTRRLPVPWSVKRIIAQQHGGQPGQVSGVLCPRCGKRGEIHWQHEVPRFLGMHIDHIKPVSKGGGNEPENLRLLCPTCNIRRGNREAN